MNINLTDANFATTIADAPRPLLVLFMSTFCGPSHALFPLLDDMFDAGEDRFDYAEIDVENCPKLTREYQVKGTPTMMFFARGQLLGSRAGTMDDEFLTTFIEGMLVKSDATD